MCHNHQLRGCASSLAVNGVPVRYERAACPGTRHPAPGTRHQDQADKEGRGPATAGTRFRSCSRFARQRSGGPAEKRSWQMVFRPGMIYTSQRACSDALMLRVGAEMPQLLPSSNPRAPGIRCRAPADISGRPWSAHATVGRSSSSTQSHPNTQREFCRSRETTLHRAPRPCVRGNNSSREQHVPN